MPLPAALFGIIQHELILQSYSHFGPSPSMAPYPAHAQSMLMGSTPPLMLSCATSPIHPDDEPDSSTSLTVTGFDIHAPHPAALQARTLMV